MVKKYSGKTTELSADSKC